VTIVDPGAIGECDARTQGAFICVHMDATEDAAARRRARPGDTSFIVRGLLKQLRAWAAPTMLSKVMELGQRVSSIGRDVAGLIALALLPR